MSDTSYYIVRFFQSGPEKIIKRGLTLDEVQKHCDDPETSSKTAKRPHGNGREKNLGEWFDGYRKEAS